MRFHLQRLQTLLRPKLAPHQLRPEDSPLDLDSEYCVESFPSPELENIIISSVPVKDSKDDPIAYEKTAQNTCV